MNGLQRCPAYVTDEEKMKRSPAMACGSKDKPSPNGEFCLIYYNKGWYGIGIPGINAGVGIEHDVGGEVSPYFYIHIKLSADVKIGVSSIPGKETSFNFPNGSYVVDMTDPYVETYVITTDVMVNLVGGYEALGRQYIFDESDFQYELIIASYDVNEVIGTGLTLSADPLEWVP